MSPVLALLRLRPWMENLFLWPALLLTPAVLTWANIAAMAQATVAFCGVTGAASIINDWCDREADRAHPVKRFRPLAAGTVSPRAAAILAVVLVAGGAVAAWDLPWRFQAVLGGCFVLHLLYSFALKGVAIVDALCVALGGVLRVAGGGMVVHVRPSDWLLILSGLLALFLVLAKRRNDLLCLLATEPEPQRRLGGYNLAFLNIAVPVVLGTLLVAYLTCTADAAIQARLGSPNLYTTAPFVVAGILRYLQIVYVEDGAGNPARIALGDRFMLCTVAGWVLTLALLVYF